MDTVIMDMVAQAHPFYSFVSIIYDIIYGSTGKLLKKAYTCGKAHNYQQMVLCGALAAINIAFVVAMAFAIAPWVKAIIMVKFAASPFIAMTITGVGSKAVNCVFGWIVGAISRKVP